MNEYVDMIRKANFTREFFQLNQNADLEMQIGKLIEDANQKLIAIFEYILNDIRKKINQEAIVRKVKANPSIFL